MSYQLKIEIQSYWHAGTGRGQGSDVDALTHRDSDGIPCLPGRTVKGLLRDAVLRWSAFDASSSDANLTQQLFGQAPDEEKSIESAFGLLRVSDAVLPDADLYHLRKDKALCAGLFRSLHATKIDPATGTAQDKSLRGIEVVVPLTLFAEISEVPSAEPVDQWMSKLEPALSLIQSVGAHRTRGLGRAVVTIEEKQS